jgi:hypothetical protein
MVMRNMRIQMSGSPEDFDMAELLLFRILIRNVIILTWHGIRQYSMQANKA